MKWLERQPDYVAAVIVVVMLILAMALADVLGAAAT